MSEHIYIKGPSRSGKTTVAKGLIHALENNGKKVCWIMEHAFRGMGISPEDAFESPVGILNFDVYVWDGMEPLSKYAPTYRTITCESLLTREEREAHRKDIGLFGEYVI